MRLAYWLVIPALACLGPAALAGENVPPVSASDLPVAGTCAPIAGDRITWLTVGRGAGTPADPVWYRVDEDPADIRADALRTHLTSRSRDAESAGATHEVWIEVSKAKPWARIVEICQLCEQAGVFRVGLQVQAESGDGIRAFPLFLPGPAPADAPTAPTKARSLEVSLVRPVQNPLHPHTPVASAPDRLFEAARRAVEHFGPVVATASIRWDVPVQDAVRAIDYLYRAGCAGVRLPYLVMVPRKPVPVVEMRVKDGGQSRLLQESPLGVTIPPVAPRETPWPDHGAAQLGALAFELEPIPSRRGQTPDVAARLKPLPSWAAGGHEVPAKTMRSVETTLRAWGGTLGKWLKAALQPGRVNLPETLLARHLRQSLGAKDLFGDSRLAFPAPDAVVVSTVRLQAFLFRGAAAVGHVDITLGIAGDAAGVIFANWVGEKFPQNLVLPPRETDPYAAHIAGRFRIWLEGILAAARYRGASALPLASEADVLAQLPPVAHAGVRSALTRRGQSMENLVAWLRATPHDRIFIAQAEGSAAVYRAGRIVGILRFDLAPEQGELSLSSLTPRVAPR